MENIFEKLGEINKPENVKEKEKEKQMTDCTNCKHATTQVFDFPCSICHGFDNFTEKTKHVSVKEANLQIVRDILAKHFDATGNEYNEAANEIINSLNL